MHYAGPGGKMKRFLPLFVILLLCVAACEYQEPLADKQGIAVDQALLGLWVPSPDNSEPPPPGEWILALKYSDTEYMLQYQSGKDSMYFRAYPLKIGNIPCMQLQLLGYSKGPIQKGEPAYQVASVMLNGDEVTIRMLSTAVINPTLRGAEVSDAFLKNSKNSKLFREPVKFRRVAKADTP
jgi:hypothetical protein